MVPGGSSSTAASYIRKIYSHSFTFERETNFLDGFFERFAQTDKRHKGPFLAEQIISIFKIIANRTVQQAVLCGFKPQGRGGSGQYTR